MKIGVNVSIDVTKVEKARLKDGRYLNMTTFINLSENDKYDNNGLISCTQTKEERESKVYTAILGNVKLFWRDDGQPLPTKQQNTGSVGSNGGSANPVNDEFEDSIPF